MARVVKICCKSTRYLQPPQKTTILLKFPICRWWINQQYCCDGISKKVNQRTELPQLFPERIVGK